jgi:DNA-directed RNA polymerase subunit M
MICPKCGHLMRPKKEKNAIVFECPVCGFISAGNGNLKVSRHVARRPEDNVIVIDNPEKLIALPVDEDVVCPKCSNRGAYVQVVQTRSADEPPTRIYTCTKCKYTWREYT